VALIDRAHQPDVLAAIARRLPPGAAPAIGSVVFAGLPMPEQVVQITADAVIGGEAREIFAEPASAASGPGRRPEDAAAQTDLALSDLAARLGSLQDVCKITVQITDRGHRNAVYNMIGRHFRGIHPVSTGLIVTALSHPDHLVAIDTHVLRAPSPEGHVRLRKYHSNAVRYGFSQQALDCDFCMAVRTGSHVVLRGQTGTDLSEAMHGAGNAASQAEQAMKNVATLLAEAGAALSDVVRATVFVTDRAFLAPVTEVVLRHLSGVVPAFGAVIVKGLASPDLLMEVDITAEIDGGGA
jgi:enamine deaminase RidA (YjgF/YER057c/UK114 family)